MNFLTLTMSLKLVMKLILATFLAINLIPNGDKLSIQFSKIGKKVLKEKQRDRSNLVVIDDQLLKKLHTFGLLKIQLCFLQNGRRGNKSPILLLQSYTIYEESMQGLFYWLFAFFTVNTTDCYFWLS